jgi:CheY-like chemotaxis protein
MKTILVLEDDPSNMRVFCGLLSSIGYNVMEATAGEEAIEFGNHHSDLIDLFISDVAVPKPSGTAVALELLKSHPAMPILFVSGTPMNAWDESDLRNFQKLPPDIPTFSRSHFGRQCCWTR